MLKEKTQKGIKRYKRHTKVVKTVSGYRGVRQRGKRWAAALTIKNSSRKSVCFHIGTFDTALEAHKARIKFINKLK